MEEPDPIYLENQMIGMHPDVMELDPARFPRRRRHQREPEVLRVAVETKYKWPYLGPGPFFIGVIILVWAYYIATQVENRLPNPIELEDAPNHPGRFIAAHALSHVINLTKIGSRPAGSFENEVLASHLLSRELNNIAKRASLAHRITIDQQKASGAFSLKFLDGMTNVYRNVQNLILKIGPQPDARYSILMNCHFDTVPDSPGGFDNSAGCAVMLEILRVISLSHFPLKNNIIFLFNGAEENFLQGSHGFITQHKWSKNIKAVINLEACGSGGRELLFQAGPENPWLMEAYSSSVPHPLASTLAQEIFQAGIFPGDTDYRIFRDHGNIPGLDFAWALNGYVYHTSLDNGKNVQSKSLQRTGDNLLALSLKLANLNYPRDSPRKGNLVFFDILGLYIFRVPESTGILLNLLVIVYSILTITKNATHNCLSSECTKRYYYLHLGMTSLVVMFSWIVSLVIVLFTSLFISSVERSMAWYSRPLWLFFLYVIPAISVPARISLYMERWQARRMNSVWVTFSLRIDSNQVIWTLLLLLLTFLRIRSSIFVTFWLGFMSIANACMHKEKYTDRGGRGTTFICVYFFIMLLPFTQFAYMINGAISVIVPTMGRTGCCHEIETLIAVLTCSMFILLFNFLIPLFSICESNKFVKTILKYLDGLMLAAFAVLLFTPFGFPYSSDPRMPAPQRYMILHVEQVIHGFGGNTISDTGGFWVVDLDVNSPRTVQKAVPEMTKALKVDSCEKYLYCGLPYIIPVLSIISESHWIQAPKPVIAVPTNLTLNQIEVLDPHARRYHFTAVGPDHITLMFSPAIGIDLVSWSFLNEDPLPGPLWKDRKTYFLYYSSSSNPVPFDFSISLQTNNSFTRSPAIDIALTGHFLHGAHQRSVKLEKLLHQFPTWTVTSGWVATYKSYIF